MTLQSPQLIELLDDPNSEALQQPPYADNWHRSAKPEIDRVRGARSNISSLRQKGIPRRHV